MLSGPETLHGARRYKACSISEAFSLGHLVSSVGIEGIFNNPLLAPRGKSYWKKPLIISEICFMVVPYFLVNWGTNLLGCISLTYFFCWTPKTISNECRQGCHQFFNSSFPFTRIHITPNPSSLLLLGRELILICVFEVKSTAKCVEFEVRFHPTGPNRASYVWTSKL